MVIYPKWLILLAFLSLLITGCLGIGTETGNPQREGTSSADGETGSAASEEEETSSYSQDEFGVVVEYSEDWSLSEEFPIRQTAGAVDDNTFASDAGGDDVAASSPGSRGIDTTNAPSTVFTDGETEVTIFFVTLDTAPASLLGYLEETFPDLSKTSFVPFSNSYISGYQYDDPAVGSNGGDQQEYFFLKGSRLLYVVAEIFANKDGRTNFNTLINSLRFQ
ncbi:MAG: hypothetical protein HY539_06445 [Deltaproteobacteria bacterium]|nr:hypothetical protein [Deltaproteobacteria bacterium]